MARDVQIRLGDGTAPQEYEVPNATEIVPLAVNATFDGSGASGDFVPAIEIVSDGGVVVARVPCQTTVTAGDSAECTFAPFLRAGSQSSGGGGLRGYQESVRAPSPLFVTSGVPLILNFGAESTNDSTGVALDFGSLTTGEHVPILTNGGNGFVYAWSIAIAWEAFDGTRTVTVDITDNAGASYGEHGYPVTAQGTDATAAQWQTLSGVIAPQLATYPAYLVTTLTQTSGVSRMFGSAAGFGSTGMQIQAVELSLT